MLGTGTPNADPDRDGPSVAVIVDETSYLVDFGVGVVRRAAAAERLGIKALAAPNLTRAFATHLHSDHTLGLADLILTPWILERPTPLTLYGPRGLRAMTRHLVAAYADDIRIRTQRRRAEARLRSAARQRARDRAGHRLSRRPRDGDRVRGAARRVGAGVRLSLSDTRPHDRHFRRHRRRLAHRGSMPEMRCAGARGVFGGGLRQAATGVAGVPLAVPHVDAPARRDRLARAAGPAGAVSPVDLELDRRGTAEGSALRRTTARSSRRTTSTCSDRSEGRSSREVRPSAF